MNPSDVDEIEKVSRPEFTHDVASATVSTSGIFPVLYRTEL